MRPEDSRICATIPCRARRLIKLNRDLADNLAHHKSAQAACRWQDEGEIAVDETRLDHHAIDGNDQHRRGNGQPKEHHAKEKEMFVPGKFLRAKAYPASESKIVEMVVIAKVTKILLISQRGTDEPGAKGHDPVEPGSSLLAPSLGRANCARYARN